MSRTKLLAAAFIGTLLLSGCSPNKEEISQDKMNSVEKNYEKAQTEASSASASASASPSPTYRELDPNAPYADWAKTCKIEAYKEKTFKTLTFTSAILKPTSQNIKTYKVIKGEMDIGSARSAIEEGNLTTPVCYDAQSEVTLYPLEEGSGVVNLVKVTTPTGSEVLIDTPRAIDVKSTDFATGATDNPDYVVDTDYIDLQKTFDEAKDVHQYKDDHPATSSARAY